MNLDCHILHMARLVLETRTPLSIATGQGEGVFDTGLVRDANGLPAIPGSSLAGVLRRLCLDAAVARTESEKDAQAMVNQLFGNAKQGAEDKTEEQASRLHVSWGCIHDSTGDPVEGLLLGDEGEERLADALLQDACREQPIVRNHVRLDHRGTAHDTGQFDRTSLRAGHRFSVELSLWGKQTDWDERSKESPQWRALLSLLYRRDFRLGGATRRGLGAMRVVSLHHRILDLADPDDYKIFCQLPSTLCKTEKEAEFFEPFRPTEDPTDEDKGQNLVTATVRLTPDDLYRFGQGNENFLTEGDAPVHLLPVGERVVEWDESGVGKISDDRRLLIPGSAIKGALRHRVGYYHRLLTGTQVLEPEQDTAPDDAPSDDAELALFGYARDDRADEGGEIGHIILDDLLLIRKKKENFLHLTHNGIDRFTGGVRDGCLYTEELAFSGPVIEFPLAIAGANAKALIRRPIRRALALALQDLVEGRLALGAGAARGHGYFSGEVTWDDGGHWIRGGGI
ncbi:MAG: hypothetical protein KJO08_02405 [Gammaproteobacteria bacterium]|nr:hypothetical protein [Gammaproteobacteria bacterium]NNJ84422.1 hypothetical protein [Gammaproteobacteria bacterium]